MTALMTIAVSMAVTMPWDAQANSIEITIDAHDLHDEDLPEAMDPQLLDDLKNRFEMYAEFDHVDEAERAQNPGYPVNVDCMGSPTYCRPSLQCSFSQSCIVSSCGTGTCNACPTRWGLGNLIVSAWCAYTCYAGQDIVGAAIAFRPRIGNKIIPWVTLCSPNR
jgi:hypothetical protein